MKRGWIIALISLLSLAVLLLPAFVLFRLVRLPPDFPDRDPDNSSLNLDKRVLDLGMRNLDSATLSPDGSLILINRRTDSIPGPEAHWLEVRDIASARRIAMIPLPSMPATVKSPFEAEIE